jgi:hypothetical protein
LKSSKEEGAQNYKRLVPHCHTLTQKEVKKLNSRTSDQKYQDLINNYFNARPILTRLDKDPKQLHKEWLIAQAYDRFKQKEWERHTEDQTRKGELIDAALCAMHEMDPDLVAGALETPMEPIPLILRRPTLTPPVPDYVPGYGFPIEGTEEDENTLLRALGMAPEKPPPPQDETQLALEEAKKEKRRKNQYFKGRLIG